MTFDARFGTDSWEHLRRDDLKDYKDVLEETHKSAQLHVFPH